MKPGLLKATLNQCQNCPVKKKTKKKKTGDKKFLKPCYSVQVKNYSKSLFKSMINTKNLEKMAIQAEK